MPPYAHADLLKSRIRTVRDWPKPGINFRDVTTLFQDPEAFRVMIEAFAQDATRLRADLIAAVDARGFIIGGALSYQMHKPFVLVRKKGSSTVNSSRPSGASGTSSSQASSIRRAIAPTRVAPTLNVAPFRA